MYPKRHWRPNVKNHSRKPGQHIFHTNGQHDQVHLQKYTKPNVIRQLAIMGQIHKNGQAVKPKDPVRVIIHTGEIHSIQEYYHAESTGPE